MELQFVVESPAFKNSADIPEDYTSHGKNISPPLKWANVPTHAKELALICEDPDAAKNPPFVHWVAYNIPAHQKELKEGAGKNNLSGVEVGKNSAGDIAYAGPNPPENSGVHRYYFRLFALDDKLGLKPGATADELMEAMRTHIIVETDVMGKHRHH